MWPGVSSATLKSVTSAVGRAAFPDAISMGRREVITPRCALSLPARKSHRAQKECEPRTNANRSSSNPLRRARPPGVELVPIAVRAGQRHQEKSVAGLVVGGFISGGGVSARQAEARRLCPSRPRVIQGGGQAMLNLLHFLHQ